MVFCLEPGDAYVKRYCEVFVTRRHKLVFHCSLCENVDGSIVAFLQHLLGTHYAEATEDELTLQVSLPNYQIKNISTQHNLRDEINTMDADTTNNLPQEATEQDFNCHFDNSEDIDEIVLSEHEENLPIDAQPVDPKKPHEGPQFSSVKNSYECDQCERVYFNLKSFNAHRKIHSSPDRIYKCEECGFGFKDPGNCKQHFRRCHSKEKSHTCKECSKMFYSRSELKSHERTHSGMIAYVCAECGKGFKHSSEFRKHTFAHNGTRPYKCVYCGKSFVAFQYLKSHIVTHTGARNHICNICDAKFGRRLALKNHMKLHENKREYVCNICQVGFNQQPALRSHLKLKHKLY